MLKQIAIHKVINKDPLVLMFLINNIVMDIMDIGDMGIAATVVLVSLPKTVLQQLEDRFTVIQITILDINTNCNNKVNSIIAKLDQ